MIQYSFGTKLTPLSEKEERNPEEAGIAIMTMEEFKAAKGSYAHRKILLHNMENIHYCKAEAFSSCTLGTFTIPDKKNLLGDKFTFGFYLSENELILIHEGEVLKNILTHMQEVKYGEDAAAGSFLILLMDYLIQDDVMFLQGYEEKLSVVEESLLEDLPRNFYQTVIQCRKELLALHTYYEQLISMGEVLETNGNHLFCPEECAAFGILENRASRLHDHVEMLREYVLQIREMYQSQIDINQNRIMSWLTVVTTIFLPLSILVGWYGMNFFNMPELQWKYGYLVMILASIVIIIMEVWFFRKKKIL